MRSAGPCRFTNPFKDTRLGTQKRMLGAGRWKMNGQRGSIHTRMSVPHFFFPLILSAHQILRCPSKEATTRSGRGRRRGKHENETPTPRPAPYHDASERQARLLQSVKQHLRLIRPPKDRQPKYLCKAIDNCLPRVCRFLAFVGLETMSETPPVIPILSVVLSTVHLFTRAFRPATKLGR